MNPNYPVSDKAMATLRPVGILLTMLLACLSTQLAAASGQEHWLGYRNSAEAAKIVKFYQRHVPGFKKAYLLAIAPFLGFRGGRHINGEHTLAIQEPHRHIKCRDVLFRYGPPEGARRRVPGFEVPYGIALPKKVHGLLVCGRGAAYLRRGHDPSLMRSRPVMMTLGQAVGTAAAVAAHDGVTPKKLDISKVQRKLLADGIFIGDEDRLKELGFR